MRITSIDARALRVRTDVELAGRTWTFERPMNHVTITTDDGLVGHGATTHAEPEPVTALVDHAARTVLLGADALATETIWQALHDAYVRRDQTGIAYNAISAIDVALWDLRARALELPLWRLLGGGDDRLGLYATCGLPGLDAAELGAVARAHVEDGFGAVKLVVGAGRGDGAERSNRLLADLDRDVERVAAVRDAVGDDVEIYLSAQCRLRLPDAVALGRAVAPLRITLFQEPVEGNDPAQLAAFRERTTIPVALGHSLGGLHRFRAMLTDGAVDVLQPNVVTSGGFTGALRVASLARAFGAPLLNGGAWLFYNAHLYAALANATLGEWFPAWDVGPMSEVYEGLPAREGGWLRMPTAPGLGFTPRQDALDRWTVRR